MKTTEQHVGPEYPNLGASVQKFRRAARKGGLRSMDRFYVVAYATAIEKAILALQRSELMREVASHNCLCASGTNYSDGADIHRAIQKQHRQRLLAYPAKVRRERTPEQWQSMYEAAIAEKRARERKAT